MAAAGMSFQGLDGSNSNETFWQDDDDNVIGNDTTTTTITRWNSSSATLCLTDQITPCYIGSSNSSNNINATDDDPLLPPSGNNTTGGLLSTEGILFFAFLSIAILLVGILVCVRCHRQNGFGRCWSCTKGICDFLECLLVAIIGIPLALLLGVVHLLDWLFGFTTDNDNEEKYPKQDNQQQRDADVKTRSTHEESSDEPPDTGNNNNNAPYYHHDATRYATPAVTGTASTTTSFRTTGLEVELEEDEDGNDVPDDKFDEENQLKEVPLMMEQEQYQSYLPQLQPDHQQPYLPQQSTDHAHGRIFGRLSAAGAPTMLPDISEEGTTHHDETETDNHQDEPESLLGSSSEYLPDG